MANITGTEGIDTLVGTAENDTILALGGDNIGSLRNYSFALEGTNTIDLFSAKNTSTRDLIAKITIADLGINSASTGTSSTNRSISTSSILDSVGSIPLFKILKDKIISIATALNLAGADIIIR
jgi:hypothetical protein